MIAVKKLLYVLFFHSNVDDQLTPRDPNKSVRGRAEI